MIESPNYPEYISSLRGFLQEAHDTGDDALFTSLLTTAETDVQKYSPEFQKQFYTDMLSLAMMPREGAEYTTNTVSNIDRQTALALVQNYPDPKVQNLVASQLEYDELTAIDISNASGKQNQMQAVRRNIFSPIRAHGLTPQAIPLILDRYAVWRLKDSDFARGIPQEHHSDYRFVSDTASQELARFFEKNWQDIDPYVLGELFSAYSGNDIKRGGASEALRGFFKGPRTQADILSCMTKLAYAGIMKKDDKKTVETIALVASGYPLPSLNLPFGQAQPLILDDHSRLSVQYTMMSEWPVSDEYADLKPNRKADAIKAREQAEARFVYAIHLDDIFDKLMKWANPELVQEKHQRKRQRINEDPQILEKLTQQVRKIQQLFGNDYIKTVQESITQLKTNHGISPWMQDHLESTPDVRTFFQREMEIEMVWDTNKEYIKEQMGLDTSFIDLSLPHQGLKLSVALPSNSLRAQQYHIFEAIFAAMPPQTIDSDVSLKKPNVISFEQGRINYQGQEIHFWYRTAPNHEANQHELFLLEQLGFPASQLSEGYNSTHEEAELMAMDVKDRQRVFLTQKPIRVPFDNYPQLQAHGYSHVDFHEHPSDVTKIQVDLYISGYDDPYSIALDADFQFDLEGKANLNPEFLDNIRVQMLRLLEKFICREPAERGSDSTGDTRSEVDMLKVLVRHPHLRTLPYPHYHYSETAAAAFWEDRHRPLEEEDAKSRKTDPLGRGKTYVQAKFAKPDDRNPYIMNIPPDVMRFQG
ncbi:MAG: hypothetical protein ACEQSA_04365 [Weeksellaceae bacterium]